MATELYPGVFVPQVKPASTETKGYKYLSFYTDVRFQNWQTALTAATASYKLEMDAYKAELRAVSEAKKAAQRSVDSITNDIAKLQDQYRSTAEKEQATNTAAENSTNRANIGAQNSALRVAFGTEHADMRANSYAGQRTPPSVDQASFDAWVGSGSAKANSTGNENEGWEMFSSGRITKPGMTLSGNEKVAADRRYVEQRMLAKGLDINNPTDRQTYLKTVNQSNRERATDAFLYNGPMIIADSGSGGANGPAVVAAGTKLVNFDESQKSRLRELYTLGGFEAVRNLVPADTKPEDLLTALGIKETASKMDEARKALAEAGTGSLVRPSSDLVGTAQDIYARRFEKLPGYERQQKDAVRRDTIMNVMDQFVTKRLSLLPSDASNEQIDAAKREAIRDASIWIQDQTLVPDWLKPKSVPPIVSPTAPPLEANAPNAPASNVPPTGSVAGYQPGIIFDVNLPGDTEYKYQYNIKTDEYTVVSGPANVGMKFGKGTKAYEKLFKDGELVYPEEPKPVAPTVPTAPPSISSSELPFIPAGPAAVGSSKQQVMDILAGKKPGEPVPLQDTAAMDNSELRAKQASRDAMKQAVFNQMGLGGMGEAILDMPSKKAADEQKKQQSLAASPSAEDTSLKVQSLVAGSQLAQKPNKVNRLLASSWGRTVSGLIDANSKAKIPQSFGELRDQLYIVYKDSPQLADRAVELLAAKFILDSKPASNR